jgi:hypothetical protein
MQTTPWHIEQPATVVTMKMVMVMRGTGVGLVPVRSAGKRDSHDRAVFYETTNDAIHRS